MIVDSMTLPEVVKAIMEDLNNMNGRIDNAVKKFQSNVLARKSRIYPFTQLMDITSSQKIKFYVAFQVKKRSEWKNPNMYVAGTFLLRDGQYGFLICPSIFLNKKDTTILILSPHFIKRYRERMLKNNGDTTETIIKEFLKKNFTFYMVELKPEHSKAMNKYSKEGVKQLAVITAEGCCIAEQETYNSVRLQTFLTMDMLSEQQIKQFQEDRHIGQQSLRLLEITGIIKNPKTL